MSLAMLTTNAFKSGIQQKYIIVTCNYEARKYGVTKLMLISEALKKCPNLVIVKGEDLTHYREMSYKITSKCSICLQYLIFNIAALSQFKGWCGSSFRSSYPVQQSCGENGLRWKLYWRHGAFRCSKVEFRIMPTTRTCLQPPERFII